MFYVSNLFFDHYHFGSCIDVFISLVCVFVFRGVFLDRLLSTNDLTKHSTMVPLHETYSRDEPSFWQEIRIEKRRGPRLKQSPCDHFLRKLFPSRWSLLLSLLDIFPVQNSQARVVLHPHPIFHHYNRPVLFRVLQI